MNLVLITPPEAEPYQTRPLEQAQPAGHRVYHLQETRFDALPPDCELLLIAPGCRQVEAHLRSALSLRCADTVVLGARPARYGSFEKLAEALRQKGCHLWGPASSGLLDGPRGLCLTWTPGLDRLPDASSPVSLISQGGALGFALFQRACSDGARFRRVISLGSNEHDDCSLLDALALCRNDEGTRLVLLCLEALRDGQKFLQAVTDLHRRGKRLIIYRVGNNNRLRAARHGGANFTDDLTWRQVADQWGLTLVDNPNSLAALSTLRGLTAVEQPLVIGSSTGLALSLCDALERQDFNLQAPKKNLKKLLKPLMPSGFGQENPLCLGSRLVRDPALLDKVLSTLTEEGQHTPCLALGPLDSDDVMRLAPVLRHHALDARPPLSFLSTTRRAEPALQALIDQGCVIFRSQADLSQALALASRVRRPLPPPVPLKGPSLNLLAAMPEQPDEGHALELLSAYGVNTAAYRHCLTLSQAHKAASELGYPVALKTVSPSFAHKAQARALALDLSGPEELRNAFGRVQERALKSHPDACLRGVIVQTMEQGLEMMIGVKNDPLFGPMVAVALGGALYEVSRDLVLRCAPVDFKGAKQMILSLKGAALLTGDFNGKPLALDALARELVKVSRLALHEPLLLDLDINPVFLSEDRALAVDAFVRKKL